MQEEDERDAWQVAMRRARLLENGRWQRLDHIFYRVVGRQMRRKENAKEGSHKVIDTLHIA